MKTITKIFGTALLAAAAVALSSCTEEVEYTPADPVDGPQVYFSPDSPSTVELSSVESSFDVTILRATQDEAVSFTLEVSDPSGLFTIPTAVSFAAGQASTTLTIGYSYNEDDFPFDTYYDVTLNIPDGYNTPYGLNEYDFAAGVPGPWTSLGMCTFADYFFFEDTYQVEIFQNDLNPNQFRLEYPYAEGLVAEEYVDDGDQYDGDQYLVLTVLQPGDVVPNGVTITESDLVNYDTYNPGWYYSSYDSYVVLYYPYYFSGYETEDMWEHNRVLSYQEPDADGNVLPAQIQLAPFFFMPDYGGGWNYSQYDEVVVITFPGVVIADYSVETTYSGKFTDASNNTYIVGDFTLGEDVEYAEVALVKTDDESEAVYAVLGGTADTQKIEESCSVNFPVSEDGTYYIVAITYDPDGEAQEYDTAKVRYSSGTSSFTPTLEGLVGWWYVSCTSYFGSNYDDDEYWVIDYSDDEDYDIMLTVFDGFICDYPIYGTFDASTGDFTFYGSQYYLNYYGVYDLYFYTYSDYYISFTLTAEDLFENPTDWFGTLMCDATATSQDDYVLGWNNLYTDVVGERVDSDPSLYSVNGASAKTSSVKAGAKTLARPATMPSNHVSRQFDRVQYSAPSARTSSVNEVKSSQKDVKGPHTTPEHFVKK